jgi:hypothetical protein
MHALHDLYMFALKGNADQCFAIIDDSFQEDEELMEIANKYENAKIEDAEFCIELVQNLEKTMGY